MNKTLKILILITAFLFFTPSKAYAQCSPPGEDPTINDLTKLACPVAEGLNILILSSGAAFVGVMFYGAIKLALSQGDEKGIAAAKATMTWGFIGFLIVLGLVTILNIVAGFFGANLDSSLEEMIQGIINFVTANQAWN